MPHARLLAVPVAVSDFGQRVQHWRSTRTKRGAMPRELWTEAAMLARQHGIYAVSKAIGLNYEALKAWTEDSSPKERRVSRVAAPRPAFVQLDPLPALSSPCAVVEVQNAGGAKMTIRLPGTVSLDVVALVNSFWSRQA